MSCKCTQPVENFPGTVAWGPQLWCLLHGLAQRSGSPVTPMYAEDERRAWLQLFKETGEIIPCPSCKQHYQDYLAAHPITALKTLALRDMNAWITTWFWTLHNDINTRLEKPIFLKDDLLTTYNRVNLRSALTMVDAPIRLAIKLTGTNLLKYIEWRKRYGILLSMYGI